MNDWLFVIVFGIVFWHSLEILTLKWKVKRNMAQIDELNEALATVSTEVDALGTEFATLEQQLQDAQNNDGPTDLTAPLETLAGIKTRLETIGTALPTPPAGDDQAQG